MRRDDVCVHEEDCFRAVALGGDVPPHLTEHTRGCPRCARSMAIARRLHGASEIWVAERRDPPPAGDLWSRGLARSALREREVLARHRRWPIRLAEVAATGAWTAGVGILAPQVIEVLASVLPGEPGHLVMATSAIAGAGILLAAATGLRRMRCS